jgi:beta-N-acetylhexosaminidase
VLAPLLAAAALAGPSAGAAQAPDLSIAQQAGQRVIFGYAGPGIPDALLRRIRRGEAGGVILFARHIPSRAALARTTRRLQAAAAGSPIDSPLLIMVDQEGGQVSRIPGPPRRSPAQVGATGSARVARSEGVAAGRLLRGLGVNVNLAPVVDIGRSGSNVAFRGRAYSGSAAAVTRLAGAFAAGLAGRDVAACFKHFPGLGSARTDEDLEINRIGDSLRTLRGADMKPYEGTDVPLVMTSTAVYPALDGSQPALFSRQIVIDELRTRLGYTGVALTDDLEVRAAQRFGSPGARATRAARAGNDLLLFAQELGNGEAGAAALERDLRAGDADQAEHQASLQRVLALRESLG